MKKLILLLFPVIVFGQNFHNLDSLQFRQTVDQLVKDTGRNYVLETDRKDDDKNNFRYINSEDPADILMIAYGSGMVGENKDLEIKGVKKWGIHTIYGKYLAIFPIWKKYGDPTADLYELQKKGLKMLTNYSISRYDENGYWRLSL